MRAFALLAIAACGSAPTTGTAPPQHRTTQSAPSGPVPSVAFVAGSFSSAHLPAVASSGELVVGTVRDPDGGRGFQNLAVHIRDRTDRLVRSIEILAASDYERLVFDDAPSPELAQRIAAANQALTELHVAHDLREMLRFEGELDALLPVRALGEGLVVEWKDARLVVRDTRGRTLQDADGRTWLAPVGQRCASCPPCGNPAYLARVSKAPALSVIAVEIGYQGTDTCWEPPTQLHVVAW